MILIKKIKMEDINYASLIKLVEESTKKSYRAYYRDGVLVPNVANLGGKVGTIAKLERSGEYYGIAVQLLEPLHPLLTDRLITKILSMLNHEDYVTPLSLFSLTEIDQLKYILDTWFRFAVDGYTNDFHYKKKYPIYDDWIRTVTHDPILGKIKLVDVGQNQNTGGPVVPVDWLDKEFTNGYELHKEMDQLETRIGKPPVTYAVIYSMIIQKNDFIIKQPKVTDYQYIFYLDVNGHKLNAYLSNKIKKKYQYVGYNKTLIGFVLDDILEPKSKSDSSQSQVKEVGLLVSRLQKAIRRGRFGSKILIDTIEKLNISPNYNLPEHGFLRVSAAKQLVWRLFISIMEDCRPYQPTVEPGLLELMLLVLITQRVQEYQFTRQVLDAIKLLAIFAQYNDTPNDLYDWRASTISEKTPIVEDSDYHNAVSLAIDNVIMMSGDQQMLRKYYSVDTIFEPFVVPPKLEKDWEKKISKIKYLDHDPEVDEDIALSSYDPHSKTYIILYYQACAPISMTTKQISNYIWDISSSYNIRSHKKRPKMDPVLRSIQKYFYQKAETDDIIKKIPSQTITFVKSELNDQIKRTTFLSLFGRKYRYGGKEVVIAGTMKQPIRIKIDNEWEYLNDQQVLNAYPSQMINLSEIDPPFGFKWKCNKAHTKIINGEPYVNDTLIPYFDGSNMIQSNLPKIKKTIDKTIYKLILEILSGLDVSLDSLLYLRNHHHPEMVNWIKESDFNKYHPELIKSVYTKVFNQFNNIITIGPVSRSGQKMHNSINYLLEGKIWAVFNLFSYLYPLTLKPNGALNFYIRKDTPGYVHLIQSLETIIFNFQEITGPLPTITTELWDHQKESVNKIINGYRNGRYGFGDASDVGAGKTLTSLKIATLLIGENKEIYSGILVLLPGNKLINTWKDEIAKHAKGFHVIFQKNNANVGVIHRNTVVVTTMGRMRDHPINHKWLLIIIDECLTVQNKNALWTEEAWKQSMISKHLVMMSATFFRTRFDKLYYMLKMLRTGLPEKKEYLDAILLESIVSQISNIKRKWTTNINHFHLDKKSRSKYESINQSDLSTERKFAKLNSLLTSNTNVKDLISNQLSVLITQLEKNNHHCLIYARSMEEAQFWSTKMDIPIYPNKGIHCIVTYNDGTYGLNDLIKYDTILMRPPSPDKLPQIKGRLDRPGQKLDHLHIEYFILENTIEEGLIIRLNIASQFIHKYIMPLAQFYDISVNYHQYQ